MAPKTWHLCNLVTFAFLSRSLNLICGLASLLLGDIFETFPAVSLPLRFLSPRNGTAGPPSEGSAAPNPCYTVLQQKATSWKVFFSGVTREFNTGREGNKGEGRPELMDSDMRQRS